MHEGQVVVTSPCLHAPKTASDSEVLEATCGQPSTSAESEAVAAPVAAPVSDAGPLNESAPAACASSASPPPEAPQLRLPPKAWPALSTSASPPSSASPVVESEPPGADWRALAKQSKTGQAWAVVDSEGFDVVMTRSSPEELMLLANLARLSGRAARAVEAYREVRVRYPGSESAATAAFHLGRLALDGGGANAQQWFRTYMQERPNGYLAQESLGRILEIDARSKNREVARSTAAAYLQKYPSGPHAGLARSVLARSVLAP